MASRNGRIPSPTAATDAAARLANTSYADKVVATLGQARMITDQLIRQAIGDFSPDTVSLHDLRRMRRDGTIKMGLYYTKALIVQAEWTMECEDPAIKAGMTEIWKNVHSPWMRTGLNMLDFGYQGAVKQYELGRIHATFQDKEGDGAARPVWEDDVVMPVILKPPVPIPPEYATPALKAGKFNGIRTTMHTTGAYSTTDDPDPDIPVEWALWFANEFEEEFNNYFGVSRILPAYEPWYAYWFTHHMRSRHVEADADPALQIWYPQGNYEDPTDKDEHGQPKLKSNREAALEIGNMLRGGGTIAWPSDVHYDEQGRATPVRLWEAAFLTGGENLQPFNEVLNDLRVEKLRAVLVPEEALTEALGGTGSRASASERIDFFTQSMDMLTQDMDRIANEYQIRAIVEANWGKDAPQCRKVTTGFREEDVTFLQALIEAAFTADANAMPIDWEALLEKTGVDILSAKDQKEKEKEQAQQAQEQAANQPPPPLTGDGSFPPGAQPQFPQQLPPGQTPQQLAASQDDRRRGSRKYETEVIHLSSHAKPGAAPSWAHREGRRRQRNVAAVSERMQSVMMAAYADAIDAAVDAVETDQNLQLGIKDTITNLVNRVRSAVAGAFQRHLPDVTGELASVYHSAGVAELSRLGLSAESWDVGRDEVQEWAREHAGELIKTIDKTLVEQHVRPWLENRLQKLGIQDDTGVPYGSLDLAQELHEKFSNYPLWMAERVVRSEARMGYNQAALDMWDRVGVSEVEAYDGLGGRTGKTDAECLARNGQRMTLDQARVADDEEHPNGTLGFIPVTVGVELQPVQPGVVTTGALMSQSLYAVTDDGLILSEAETGRVLAGE